jgi:hypothetical protein
MIGACYHKDPTMLKYLKDKNSDMHSDMAKQIFIFKELDKTIPEYKLLRQAAKNGFVFPQFYGDYYKNNAEGICDWVQLPHKRWKSDMGIVLPGNIAISDHFIKNGITSFNDFVEHMKQVEDDFWNKRFMVYNQWKQQQIQQYRKYGHLKTLTGFVCSGIMRDNEITNYPIQGTAFHCLLKTFTLLNDIRKKEKWDSKLIGQIHDSTVMDICPDEEEHVKQTIEKIVKKDLPSIWKWIIVPLEIEIETYGIDQPWIIK